MVPRRGVGRAGGRTWRVELSGWELVACCCSLVGGHGASGQEVDDARGEAWTRR
jgi:hypothetical protein